MDAVKTCEKTDIRPNTINELYHELTERINLEHLDKICEVLDCDLSEILIREDDGKQKKR